MSVISSAVAVVPRRSRSRPDAFDHSATRSRAPGSSSHGASMPGVWEPCPGASNAITSIKRTPCERTVARCRSGMKLVPRICRDPTNSHVGVRLSADAPAVLHVRFTDCEPCDWWCRRFQFVMTSSQSTHRCRDPQHVRIAWIRGIPPGDFCDSLQSIPDGIWMNKQLTWHTTRQRLRSRGRRPACRRAPTPRRPAEQRCGRSARRSPPDRPAAPARVEVRPRGPAGVRRASRRPPPSPRAPRQR